MKEFIETHTALNHRELCRLIDWSPSSFNQWRKGVRGIPDDKAKRLKDVLSEYGFKGQN
ncbi:MAG: hypothetical protein WC910_09245 [Bacteroidales bacterium]|jgi:DNA-binding transcriptional regulator YdaS (Cro superfamily)